MQGNNEAVTYLRYQDTSSTSYVVTDDWSVSTAIDESFTNLSSECLIDGDFSELCDVYNLNNDFEEEDFFYGVDEDIIFGYDDEEIYGFNTGEDEFSFTTSIVFQNDGFGRDDDYSHDDSIIIYDIQLNQEYELENDTLFIHKDVYETGFDYELSILGYYNNYPDIYKVINRLMNYSNQSYNNLLSNYKFYCPNYHLTLIWLKK